MIKDINNIDPKLLEEGDRIVAYLKGQMTSEEEQQLMFAPFYSGRQAGRGLGFGLPKALRYTEALGMRLVCEKSRSFPSGQRWSVVY